MAVTVFTNHDDPAAHEIARDLKHILKKPAPDPETAKSLASIKTVYAQLSQGKLDRSLLTRAGPISCLSCPLVGPIADCGPATSVLG